MNRSEVWKINLTALGVSQFIYRAGSRSLIPFLPLFIQDLGKTNFESTALWSGWIFAAPFIVSFFTTPLWGSFGDRFGRKLMTLLAVFGFAASQMLMGISANLLMLFIFSSLQEALGGFYPAAVSLTAANTPEEKSSYALGMIQFANSAGNVTGPVIGGILAALFGYREVFYLVGISSALAGIIVLIFVREEKFEPETKSFYSITNNIKYLLDKKVLLSCGLFLLIYSLSVSLLRPTFSLFIQSLHFEGSLSATTGILLGIYGAFSALSSALFGKFSERKNLRTFFILTILMASASSFLIMYASSILSLSVLLAVSGFSLGLILPLIYTILTRNIDRERKSGIFGIGSSFSTVGSLSGSILSGIVVSNMGAAFPFAVSAFLFLFVVPISILGLKETSH